MESTELELWNLRAHQSGVRRMRRNAARVRCKSIAHCNASETKKCERKQKGFYLETLNAHDNMAHCNRRLSFLGHHTSYSFSALEWGTYVILINKMNTSKHMYVPLALYLGSLSSSRHQSKGLGDFRPLLCLFPHFGCVQRLELNSRHACTVHGFSFTNFDDSPSFSSPAAFPTLIKARM